MKGNDPLEIHRMRGCESAVKTSKIIAFREEGAAGPENAVQVRLFEIGGMVADCGNVIDGTHLQGCQTPGSVVVAAVVGTQVR